MKMTKVELELQSDPDMLLIIESSTRGGIAIISYRYATDNNKYMGTEFDPGKESIFIYFLDVNGLYARAMSRATSNMSIQID